MPEQRWSPDELLIPAVLCGGTRRMSDLSAADRAWLVAGLTRAGVTAESIADRMSCSLRLVRTIKADPMTALATMMQAESDNFANEMRLLRSEHSRALAAADAAQAELESARRQIARLTTAAAARRATHCTAGHALTLYNTYVASTGKRYCRECHRLRQARYRSQRRQTLGL